MVVKVFSIMFSFLLFTVFVLNVSHSLTIADREEKCSCYSVCNKNFTTNSIHDVSKISACHRGCRFHSLVLHTVHETSQAKALKRAEEGCIRSCTEGYLNPIEMSACKFGCSAVELARILCNTVEIQTPQVSYSFLIEESDILIHPGEPEPDDSLTDPGLRKQIQKTLAALLDATPKIPEIRFKNLPVKPEKSPEYSHSTFKCPKFYGLDSKFEFRNGKIIIGDLYLFVGVFIFVVLCFLLGHHMETKNIKRQLMESRLSKKDFGDKEPLLKLDINEEDVVEKDDPPEYYATKYEISESNGVVEQFEEITIVFNEDEAEKETPVENSVKI